MLGHSTLPCQAEKRQLDNVNEILICFSSITAIISRQGLSQSGVLQTIAISSILQASVSPVECGAVLPRLPARGGHARLRPRDPEPDAGVAAV